MRLRYGAWTGTQDPFPAEVSPDAVLDAVADDLLDGVDPTAALRRLAERGLQGRVAGLDELRRRVAEARRRELERMGLEGPLAAIAERLEEIVQRERTAAAFDATPMAAQRQAELDALPDDVAGRLARLGEHDWADASAKGDFDALLDERRADLAAAHFGRLAGALGELGPDDVARMRDFLADVNALVDRRDRGEDVEEGWRELAERHADLLAALGDPEDLDALLVTLAERMAAASRMLASLSAEQRAQLQAMTAQLLGDDGLAFESDRLRRTLARDFPHLGWDEGVEGADPDAPPGGSLRRAVDLVAHVGELDDLAEALGQRYPGATLEDVDEDAVRRLLGEDAARDLRGLREIERVLEEAGAARRVRGRLELTPMGIRRLGESALARIYERALAGPEGAHRAPTAGGAGEPTGATRPWRFGDPFRLDVSRTVRNAVLRRAGEPGGARPGHVLAPEDLELAEAEQRVRVATVLLLDMSFSMPLRGNWGPAKRVALALQALVSSKFPEDRLSIIGFSDYARRLQPADLLVAGWERVYGTNMEHAFRLARRELEALPGAERQVIMITDGEPTAHLEDGVPRFAWPPEPETLHRTMAEAARLARTGATLNVFLLDHDPGAAAFIERMVRTFRGRLFHPRLDDLGDVVVRDFLAGR